MEAPIIPAIPSVPIAGAIDSLAPVVENNSAKDYSLLIIFGAAALILVLAGNTMLHIANTSTISQLKKESQDK